MLNLLYGLNSSHLQVHASDSHTKGREDEAKAEMQFRLVATFRDPF